MSHLNWFLTGHPTLGLFRNPLFTSVLLLHQPLDDSDKESLGEWDHLSKDQPVLDPLEVGGGGQLVEDADQQGGDRQHHREVHRDGGVEELRQLEEGGDVAEDDQEERGKEGVFRLNGQSSLERDLHLNNVFIRILCRKGRLFSQIEVSKTSFSLRIHLYIVLNQIHCRMFAMRLLQIDQTNLRERNKPEIRRKMLIIAKIC